MTTRPTLALSSFLAAALMGSAALAAPSQTAQNASYSSWYGGIGATVDFASSSDVKGTSTGSVDYNTSVSISSLSLGYRPESLNSKAGDVRFEAELLGRGFDLDKTKTGATTNSNPKGMLQTGALMANAYVDVHTGTSFTPYLGAGIGTASAHFSKNPGFGITDKDSNSNELAYQFMTGVTYTPEAWPHTDWSVGYNYFTANGPEFDTATGHVQLDDIQSNSVQMGFKYHF